MATVSTRPMEYVGRGVFAHAHERSFSRFFQAMTGLEPILPVERRTDYPPSTGRPPAPKDSVAAASALLLDAYCSTILWVCNGYSKLLHRAHVWIESADGAKTRGPFGSGNRARRRLGQVCRWVCEPPRRGENHGDEHGWVWFKADGSPAAEPPWTR